MSERIDFLTPVGRLVMGDCFTPQTKDAEGNPLVYKRGPNAGQPRVDYYMGLAIRKDDPGWPELYAKIHGMARQSFPNLFDASGTCLAPDFSMKYVDGDSTTPNKKGNRPCDKEGFPGHHILNFSGGFAPKCYTAGGASILTDPTSIKRGYFIRISGSTASNESPNQPGIYLNHSMVELIGYGEEIVTGPDGAAVFGGHPVANVPAGMSQTPPAPTTAPAHPGAGVAAPPAPGAGVAAPPAAPAHDYLNPAGAPPPPATVAPAAPEHMYNVNGAMVTRGQLLAGGWTSAQIDALPA